MIARRVIAGIVVLVAGGIAAGAARAGSFAGVWETDFGMMRLETAPTGVVTGRYGSWGAGGTIEGRVEMAPSTVKGQAASVQRLVFRYAESSERGEGQFDLTSDGTRFAGQYQVGGGSKDKFGATGGGKSWSGTRVIAQPDVRWLVVIEADWEQNLREQEYSFGGMLKSYFSRLPDVRVRHRRFTDEASLRRAVADVAYLLEPVVLVISTHGESDGIPTPGGNIDAAKIASILSTAPNVSLVHFASCLMLKDKLAEQIHAALGKNARFPISGYTEEVDWGASAVFEFGYYEMLLAKDIAPARAGQLMPKLFPFATGRSPSDAFPRLGFRMVLP